MTEDLSTMTFEERHSFWNNQFRKKKEQQDDAEIQGHQRQDDMEEKHIRELFENAIQDPQKRAALKQFFKTLADDANPANTPTSSQTKTKTIPPHRDPRDGR